MTVCFNLVGMFILLLDRVQKFQLKTLVIIYA